MNNTHYRSVLLGIILFFSGTVMAQVSKGDKQVQFLGSVYSQPEDTYRFVNAIFNLKASAYVSNNLELGVGGILRLTGFEAPYFGGGTGYEVDTGIGLVGFLSYSFLSENSKLVPYLGAQVFTDDIISDNINFFVGGNAGLRYFITEMVNLDAGLNAGTGISSDAPGALIIFQFGLGILLPSDF